VPKDGPIFHKLQITEYAVGVPNPGVHCYGCHFSTAEMKLPVWTIR